jgi:ClpP class serine protease
MLRGEWAIHPEWVSANLALIQNYLQGDSAGAVEADTSTEATLMYRPMYRVSPYTNISALPEGSTAFVDVVGVITKYGGMCSYGARSFAALVNEISGSENIGNVIFHIDSPGGQVSGTQLFADAIKACNKRTIAFINDGYAASAAMWIASACGEIYCSHATDQVGSVGVYVKLIDEGKYLESKGLQSFEIYAPQSTEKNGTSREALSGNDKPMKESLSVLADAFINTIKANRGAKLTGNAWEKGAMFYAPEALQMGLIDGIKSLAEITAMLEPEQEHSSTETTTPNMFGKNKFPAVTALAGVAAEDITEELVNAANAELHAAGLDKDVTLASTSSIQASADRIAALEAQVAELGKQPGGYFKSASTKEAGDKSEASDDTGLDQLAHNRTADLLLG